MRKISDDALQWMRRRLKPDRVQGVESVHVETGALCNLRCPYCATGAGDHDLSRGFLSPSILARILDRLGPGVKYLKLYKWGEPLLNPRLEQLIREAARRKIAVEIHTNLSIPGFDAAAAGKLIGAGLYKLWVSCDGASQRTYEQYRVGGDFELVMRNLRLLVAARDAQKAKYPAIIWKFLLHRGNEHEKSKARRLARQLGVELEFLNLVLPEVGAALKPASAAARDKRPDPTRAFCLQAWDTPNVHSDGTVLACCALYDARFALGNLLEQPFSKVWNAPTVVAMRRYLKSGAAGKTPIPCLSCPHDPYRHSDLTRLS